MKVGKKNINGFDDLIISESLPNGYEDISSIGNFIKVGNYLFKDYKFTRKILQQIDFNTLSLNEKIEICKYKASTEANCKEFLGESFEYWMSDFDRKSIACRKIRFSYAKTILLKNISLIDRYTVLGALNNTRLVTDYTDYGIEGISEGDPVDGLFNFIEATSTFNVNGLANMNLTMIGQKTKAEMIIEIMACLRDGNY